MEEDLIGIKNTALSFILEAEDLQSLEETKQQFLGRSGKLTLAIKEVTKVPAEKEKNSGFWPTKLNEPLKMQLRNNSQS